MAALNFRWVQSIYFEEKLQWSRQLIILSKTIKLEIALLQVESTPKSLEGQNTLL